MESKNELHDLKCKEKQNLSSKDIPMKEMSSADTKVKLKENSNDFMNQSFVNNTSGTQSTILSGTLGIQKQQTNIIASRSVIAAVILLVIGTFSIPIILYYTLKTDPIPELNSVLGEVNISESMVILIIDYRASPIIQYC